MENKHYNTGIDQTIVCSGDSLTAGSGGTAIATLISSMIGNRFIHTEAIGGQTSEQIAARMGANVVYVTLSGNSTSGNNKISVTSISTQLLSTAADTNTRFITGTLLIGTGIQCVLERTVVSTVETYTLQPVISQTVSVPPGTIFVPDNKLNYKSAINIVWWGRNNTPSFSTTKTLVDNYVNNLDSPKRVLILGVLNSSTEVIGTSNYNAIVAHNATLQSTYGDWYVPVTPPTIQELAYFSYTPNSNDIAQINNGTFPDGTRADSVHLNNLGYSVIGKRIYDSLKSLEII